MRPEHGLEHRSVLQDLKDHRVNKDLPDRKDHQGLRVRPGSREHKDLKGQKGHQGLRVYLGNKVNKELRECPVYKVNKGLKGFLESRVCLVLSV